MFPTPEISNKTDFCFYCHTPITTPPNEMLAKCPNPTCKKINIFLCHIINLQQNLNDIICLKCSRNYLVLTCETCGGFQAWSKTSSNFSNINNFKNGHKHQCQCGSTSTLIYCNRCQSLLSLKGKKSHQLSIIKCKKCLNQFRYKICSGCEMIDYKDRWDLSEIFLCLNGNCQMSQVKNPYELGGNQLAKHNSVSQGEKQQQYQLSVKKKFNHNQDNKQKVEEKELCKICFTQQANTINTKCYHLAVCQKCAYDLKNQCPICRSKGGQFKKIFKA